MGTRTFAIGIWFASLLVAFARPAPHVIWEKPPETIDNQYAGTIYTAHATLDGYDFLEIEARLDKTSAEAPNVLLRLQTNHGVPFDRLTDWLNVSPYVKDGWQLGTFQTVRVPINAFRSLPPSPSNDGDDPVKRFVNKFGRINFAGEETEDYCKSVAADRYTLTVRKMTLTATSKPVPPTAIFAVDTDVLAVVFPDAADAKALGDSLTLLRQGKPVPMADLERWFVPKWFGHGRTREEFTFYLPLKEALLPGETYGVRFKGSESLDPQALTFHFDPLVRKTPAIKVNQEGYALAGTRRYAYLGYWAGTLGAIDFSEHPTMLVRQEGRPAFTRELPIEPMPLRPEARGPDGTHDQSGEHVAQIDLSLLPEGFGYYLVLPGVGRSHRFEISDLKTFSTYYVLGRGFFHQRFAAAKPAAYTSWPREKADHTVAYVWEEQTYSTGQFPEGGPTDQPLTIRGGHHDAGDFDVRPQHAQIASALMTLVEFWPEKFRDGDFDIPESGNGTPDLLDEALHQLQVWLDLQITEGPHKGAIRPGIEASSHPDAENLFFADEDYLTYWTPRPDPNVSAYIAGLMAHASRFGPIKDRPTPAQYRSRAQAAFAWAKANGAAEPSLMMGAAQLFAAATTDEERAPYRALLEGPHGYLNKLPSYSQFPSNGLLHFFWLLGNEERYQQRWVAEPLLSYISSPHADRRLRDQVVDWILSKSEEHAVRNALDDAALEPYRSCGRAKSHIPWGQASSPSSALHVLCAAVANRYASDGDQAKAGRAKRYADALSLNADYFQGCNALGYCWITGLGEHHPQQLLDMDSLAWVDRFGHEQVPGLVSYGPSSASKSNHDRIREVTDKHVPPFASLPEDRMFADVWPLIPSSEFTINETCLPALMTMAMLLPDRDAYSESALARVRRALRASHVERNPGPESYPGFPPVPDCDH